MNKAQLTQGAPPVLRNVPHVFAIDTLYVIDKQVFDLTKKRSMVRLKESQPNLIKIINKRIKKKKNVRRCSLQPRKVPNHYKHGNRYVPNCIIC